MSETKAKDRRGWYWPLLVVGLLLCSVVPNVVLLLAANSDPGFAVEEDYYKKALAWDATMAQERHNAELGWDATVLAAPGATGGVVLTAQVKDRDGEVVTPDAIEVEAFHNARAAHILRASLERADDGSFAAALPMRRPGLWELRLVIRRGDDRFTQVIRQDIVPPPPDARLANKGRESGS